MPKIPASPQCAGKTLLLQVDGLGSIVAERGFGRGEWSFLPYGQFLQQRAVGGLRFAGQWFDPPVQGYLLGNGNRLYSPAIMRFLSPDSLSPFGVGGVNVYAYCSGDPINYHDPSGQTRTLLSKRLKKFDLPKAQLRDYLNPLIDIKNFGKTRVVYRLKGEEFERFEFKGMGYKITGSKLSKTRVLESYINDEQLYRLRDLFIPESSVPQEAVAGLVSTGFKKFKFNESTLLEAVSPEEPSTRVHGIADPSPGVQNNLYNAHPVVARARIRNTQPN